MYDDYAPILEETKMKLLKISKFESENIIATIIKEICESGKYGALDFKFNYPLRNILKLQGITDADDKKFILNPNTHCDFVIYNNFIYNFAKSFTSFAFKNFIFCFKITTIFN